MHRKATQEYISYLCNARGFTIQTLGTLWADPNGGIAKMAASSHVFHSRFGKYTLVYDHSTLTARREPEIQWSLISKEGRGHDTYSGYYKAALLYSGMIGFQMCVPVLLHGRDDKGDTAISSRSRGRLGLSTTIPAQQGTVKPIISAYLEIMRRLERDRYWVGKFQERSTVVMPHTERFAADVNASSKDRKLSVNTTSVEAPEPWMRTPLKLDVESSEEIVRCFRTISETLLSIPAEIKPRPIVQEIADMYIGRVFSSNQD